MGKRFIELVHTTRNCLFDSFYHMKKQLLLCLSLTLAVTSISQAQFSAGALVGAGHLWERQENSFIGSLGGVDAAQPLLMAGVYGQFVTKGRKGFVVGLQVRYQSQRQSQRFVILPPTLPVTPTNPFTYSEPEYNRYGYLVATPYLGIRLFDRLDLAAGPEVSLLLNSRLVSFRRDPVKTIAGYNLKATIWFGQLGIEGGYSRQTSAFDNELALGTSTNFYNRYAYGAVKYNLIKGAR